MGRQAANQTRLAIDAFADADPAWAFALADMDDAMDDLTKSLFRYILSLAPADEAAVQQAVQMGLVARHYERDRGPRGHDRRAGRVHGDRRAPRRLTPFKCQSGRVTTLRLIGYQRSGEHPDLRAGRSGVPAWCHARGASKLRPRS